MVYVYHEEMKEADPINIADLEDSRFAKKKFEPTWALFSSLRKDTHYEFLNTYKSTHYYLYALDIIKLRAKNR